MQEIKDLLGYIKKDYEFNDGDILNEVKQILT